MSFGSNRTDNAHDITYPTSADARGSTRINHKRRPYYLGPYESPASYIMFGLWKHRLIETGEAPPTKEIRSVVEALLRDEPPVQPAPQGRWIGSTVLIGTLCLSLAIVCAAKILSSEKAPKVDEVALTEDEMEVIRGFRAWDLAKHEVARDRSAAVAALTSKFMEEGPGNGNQHVARKGL